MNRKNISLFFITAFLITTTTNAQIIVRTRSGITVLKQVRQNKHRKDEKFKLHFHVSTGYGIPNVDQSYLPEYYSFSRSRIYEKGPFTGSLDLQLNKKTSVGLLVTSGSVSAAYHNYNPNSPLQEFTGRFDNYSVMFSLNRYLTVNSKIIPYTRIAMGVNLWKQSYIDSDGANADVSQVDLPELAFQASVGVKLKIVRAIALFVDAGYGKYILNAGFSFSFYHRT